MPQARILGVLVFVAAALGACEKEPEPAGEAPEGVVLTPVAFDGFSGATPPSPRRG